MSYFKIFIQLLPYLFELIKQAEAFFADKPKSGPEKKAAVLEAVESIINGTMAVVTGGAADTWTKLRPLIEKTVDVICGFIFNVHTSPAK